MCTSQFRPSQGRVMQWHPGRNNPLVYRGRGGEVCDQARLLVANLLWNVRHNGAAVFANAMPAPGGKQGEKAMRCSVVAQLLGIPHQTVRGIEKRLDTNGWVVIRNRRARTWQDGEQKSGKRARTRQESTSKLASGSSDDVTSQTHTVRFWLEPSLRPASLTACLLRPW